MKPLDEKAELQVLNMLIKRAGRPAQMSARAGGPSWRIRKRPS